MKNLITALCLFLASGLFAADAPPYVRNSATTNTDAVIQTLFSAPLTNGNAIWIDPVNGSNLTGKRGVREKPYKDIFGIQDKVAGTYFGAITNAQGGDTIIAMPGTHYWNTAPLNLTANGVNLWIMPGATVIRTNKYFKIDGTLQTVIGATPSVAGPMIIPGNNSTITVDGRMFCTNTGADASIGWKEGIDPNLLGKYGFTNMIATNVTIVQRGYATSHVDGIYFSQTNTARSGLNIVGSGPLVGSYDYIKVHGPCNLNTYDLRGFATNDTVNQISQGFNIDSGVIWNDYGSIFGAGGSSSQNNALSVVGTTNYFHGTRLFHTTAIVLPAGGSQSPYYYSTNSTSSGCLSVENENGVLVYDSCGNGVLTNNVQYATNTTTMAPDFTKGYGYIETNAAFTVLAPIGLTATKAETCVMLVTNSTASAVVITPAAGWKSQGTWYVTNVSAITVFHYGTVFTNATCLPLY